MNNIWKRSLSMLLALVMVVGMLPMNALAAEQETSDDFAEVVETDVPDCAEGHAWGLWEPTEDESAEYRVCTVCGETETYVYEVVETVVAEAQAAAEAANLADAEGIIWMDEDKHNNSGNGYFKGQIMKGNLDNIIRKAVGLGYADEDTKVTYDSMDVGNIYALAMYQDKLNKLQDDLTNAVTNHQLVTFNVGGSEMDIAFLNILSVNVKFTNEEISGKAAPADLAGQVAAKLAAVENSVQIKHYDQNYVISLDEAGADISAYTNSYAWPVAGKEVVAAEVAVTIYDSVDGTAHTQYGEVVLKDTRNVFTVTYLDADGTVLLSESVVENEATPVCNPTRKYYTLSWDKEIAATVTGDVTYNATWTPDLDVNDNDVADQDETFKVTYTDGVEDSVVFEDVVRPVKWGKATPSYTPSRKYYTFDGWDKAVAATVTDDVTYTATWKAINDDDGDNIANEEEFYTITYVDDNGNLITEFSVKWGEATQMPADPERPGTGYRFGGWVPAVAAKVTGDAEYTATWTNSSIVTFNMYGFEFVQPVNNEGKVANPAPDTNDDGVVWEGWIYTDENGVEKVWDFENDTTTEDITLVARYADDTDNDGLADGTEMDPMHTYIFQYNNWITDVRYEMARFEYLDGAQPEWLYWEENPNDGQMYLRADASAIYVEDTDNDNSIFQGWLAAQIDESNPASIVYTFNSSVSWDYNNNGIEDETPEDPAQLHYFKDLEGNNMILDENGFEHVYWIAGYPEVNPNDYVALLNLPASTKFVKWEVEVKEVPFGYPGGMFSYVYTPVVMEDANDNGKADEEEEDKLVMKMDDELVSGQLINEKWHTDYAILEVVDANGNNQLIKNEDNEMIFTLTDDTVITVVPAEGFYVNDISISGPNTAGWVLTWNEDYSATYAKASVYLRAGVARNAAESAYSINIDLQPKDFTYKIVDNNLELDIDKVAEYDAEKIYNELIKSPAYADGTVTVEYLDARSNVEEKYRTIHLHKIIEDLVSDTNIVSAAKGFVDETIVVDLGDAWVDVDGASSTYYQTADEAAIAYLDENGFLDENGQIIVDNLIAAVDTLEDDLTNAVKNNTMLSPFSYIEEGKEWELRSLRITFKNEKFAIVDEGCTVQLKETRSDVTIKAAPMTLSYYQVNDDVLKNNIKVIENKTGRDVTAEVKDYIKLSYDKNVGTKTVSIELLQTGAYKAAKGSFQLTVKPTAVSFEVPNIAIAMDEVNSFTYEDVKPVVTPSNFTDYVQVIAGVDVSGLDLDVQKDPAQLDMKNIQIKAWIKLPGLYNEVLNAVNLGTGFHTVEQIEAALAGSQMDGKLPLDKISAALDKAVGEVEGYLYNKVGLETKLTICFEPDAVPDAAGAYINYVTTMDALLALGAEEGEADSSSNYNITPGQGIIVIHPLTVLPNNGIQLFLGETSNTQNIFEIIIDGENKDLGVLYEGNVVDCNVHYYGFTTRANVYISTEGPQEAGIYIAAAALYDGEEKLGTDMAVMLMAPEISNIEVDSQKVKYDGEAHKLVPTVTDSKGNVLTEGVGITMITGSVDVDAGDANVGLSDISANLNIDFPKDLDDAWNHYIASRFDVPEEITVQTVLNFLDWCKTQIDTKVPVELLTKVVDKSYITKAQDYAKAGIDKIIVELEKLPDVNASVTFEDNKQFTEHGIYVYCGVVTDPDLLPDANAGVLVIYTADTFLMTDTVKVYNGLEQMPDLIDETGRDRIDMIVDRAANRVNFKLDGDATKLIEKIEKKFNVTINNNEIALQELYDRSGLKAEDLANTIIDYIWEQVPERLTNRFPGAADKVEEMIEKLEGKLPGVRAKLINKLVEIDKLPDDLTLAFNKPGAIEVGTYEFHSFSYEIGYTTAMLEIIDEVTIGTFSPLYGSLELESWVHYNFKVKLDGFNMDQVTEMGLLKFNTRTDNRDDSNYDTADDNNYYTAEKFEANKDSDGYYHFQTDGVPAKNMGDDGWYRVYAKMIDGTIVYSGRYKYNARVYAEQILPQSSYSDDMKELAVAVLNYGAAAQLKFDHKTDNLMNYVNNIVTQEILDDVRDFDADSMIDERIAKDDSKYDVFAAKDANVFPSNPRMNLTLLDAITMNVEYTHAGDSAAESGILLWTEADYLAASELTWENATENFVSESGNTISLSYAGVPAKEMAKTVFICAYVKTDAGYAYSGVRRVSIDYYAELILTLGIYDDEMKDLASHMVVYGECAEDYFVNKGE